MRVQGKNKSYLYICSELTFYYDCYCHGEESPQHGSLSDFSYLAFPSYLFFILLSFQYDLLFSTNSVLFSPAIVVKSLLGSYSSNHIVGIGYWEILFQTVCIVLWRNVLLFVYFLY